MLFHNAVDCWNNLAWCLIVGEDILFCSREFSFQTNNKF